MNKVKINKASLKDLSKLLSMTKSFPAFMVSKDKDFIRRKELSEWIKRNDCIVLTAKQEKNITGFLLAKLISSDWCLLDSIGVKPEFRGQGIGSKLLEELYLVLKKKDVWYLQCLVKENEKETREFWKKKGFKEGNKFVWIEKHL
ncbi:MAG: GNAT family N-acetyltransferase [archaeon]